MTKIETDEYWNDILEKFSKHKGSIASFCRKYDVNVHRLYHRRKKLKSISNEKFYAINLNEDNNMTSEVEPDIEKSINLKIEIGKATISLSNINNESLPLILKEVIRTC